MDSLELSWKQTLTSHPMRNSLFRPTGGTKLWMSVMSGFSLRGLVNPLPPLSGFTRVSHSFLLSHSYPGLLLLSWLSRDLIPTSLWARWVPISILHSVCFCSPFMWCCMRDLIPTSLWARNTNPPHSLVLEFFGSLAHLRARFPSPSEGLTESLHFFFLTPNLNNAWQRLTWNNSLIQLHSALNCTVPNKSDRFTVPTIADCPVLNYCSDWSTTSTRLTVPIDILPPVYFLLLSLISHSLKLGLVHDNTEQRDYR
jgi:hypothetical protein